MLDVTKTENMKNFKKCITDIVGKEVAPMSISIYNCWKLFNSKYGDMPSWKKSATNQTEWLSYLATLAKDNLDKEMNRELQFGTTNGIYMTLFFFKAIVLNEEAKTINAMTDYMEKFNRIGYQISQTSIEPIGFQRPEKSNPRAEAHAH
jgi:hypothetical protein